MSSRTTNSAAHNRPPPMCDATPKCAEGRACAGRERMVVNCGEHSQEAHRALCDTADAGRSVSGVDSLRQS